MSTLRVAHPYTATDSGIGVTADSLRVWQDTRARFSNFVRAPVCSPTGAAGPAYADSAAQSIHPTMCSSTTFSAPAKPRATTTRSLRVERQTHLPQTCLAADA